MYLFINKDSIQKYNGEVLKRYVGKRLVKTISNPTDEELREFGYMELIDGELPDYDAERQYLYCEYEVVDGVINCSYIVEDIPQIEKTEG